MKRKTNKKQLHEKYYNNIDEVFNGLKSLMLLDIDVLYNFTKGLNDKGCDFNEHESDFNRLINMIKERYTSIKYIQFEQAGKESDETTT